MGTIQHMTAEFSKDNWKIINDRGNSLHIGKRPDGFAPNDLLLGALEGCLYATFDEVAEKMRVSCDLTAFEVTGVKRDAEVATLESCTINATMVNPSDEKRLHKAFEIATRYCSVFQTIAKTARMNWSVTFKTE
jgi:putative redox protein